MKPYHQGKTKLPPGTCHSEGIHSQSADCKANTCHTSAANTANNTHTADIHTKYGVISRLLDDHPPVEPQSVCPGRGACLQPAVWHTPSPLGQERRALVGILATVSRVVRCNRSVAAQELGPVCRPTALRACVFFFFFFFFNFKCGGGDYPD